MADKLGGSGRSFAEEMAELHKESRISELASRASVGDETALEEAKAGDGNGLLAWGKDVIAPFAGGISTAVGGLAHTAASALHYGGISDDRDPNSVASSVNNFGEKARNAAHGIEGMASEEKQVRDRANQMDAERLADQGDHIGAAIKVAGYKTRHGLETASELAGALAVPIAIGAATGGVGAAAGFGTSGVAAAGMAGRMAAFGGSTAGNASYDVYQKYKNADPKTLAALNPEFAANQTPENQERIARAEATKRGMIDFGLNAVLTEFGPAGKLIRGSTADGAAGVIRAGLGRITGGGGITAASRMAAASPTLSYARGVGKDIGVFAGQAAAVQANLNAADMGVDPNAKMSTGVAAAVGAAIPAAVGMGLKNRAGERSQAQREVNAAQLKAREVEQVMAREGLDVEKATAKVLGADAILATRADHEQIDMHQYLKNEVKGDAVEANRAALRDDILTSARDDVIEGRAPDMKTAVKARQEADTTQSLHESIYQRALDDAKSDVHAKAIEAGKAKTESEKINNGKAVAEEFAKSKGDTPMTFEEFAAKPENGVNEKARSNYETYQNHRTSRIDEAKTRSLEAFDRMPEPSAKQANIRASQMDKMVDKAMKEAGVKKSSDIDPVEIKQAIRTELESRSKAKEEAGIHEAARQEMVAERQTVVKQTAERSAAKSKKIVEEQAEKAAIEQIDPTVARELGEAVKQAPKEAAKSVEEANVFAQKAAENEMKIEEAARVATKKGFEEIVKSSKRGVDPAKIDAFRRQVIERHAAEAERGKTAMVIEKNIAEEVVTKKAYKDLEAMRGTKDYNDVLSAVDRIHLEMQEKFAKSKDQADNPAVFQYDHKKAPASLKKAVEAYLHKSFPGTSPVSRAGRNAMHIELSNHWKLLNGGKKTGEARKEVNAKLKSEGKPEIFRLDDSSRPVNGNIHAGMKITPEEVVRVMQSMTNVPLKKLAKFIKISTNFAEAFAHDPARVEAMREQAGGHPVKGLYDPKTGTVHFFTETATGSFDVMQTLTHEINHRGLGIIMNEMDVAAFRKFSQTFMNGNSYVRKLTAELVAKRRIPENATPEIKLAETMAYMAENLDTLKTGMARGTLSKLVMELRSFMHNVITKVFGKEHADNVVPFMSDADVVDAIRKVTNRGFDVIENAKGERFTTLVDGRLESNYLFRQGDYVEGIENLQDRVSRFNQESGLALKPVAFIIKKFVDMGVVLTHKRTNGEVRPALEAIRSSRTKADQDVTGKLKEGLDIAASAHRLDTSLKNDALKIAGNINTMNGVDGSIRGMGSDVARAAKWMTDAFQGKSSKFIGEHLRGLDDQGIPKLYTPVEIDAILAQHGEKLGIKPSEHAAVKEKYSSKVRGSQRAREDLARARIIDAMQVIKSSFGGEAGKKIAALAHDEGSLRQTPIKDLKDAFDAIVKTALDEGDFAEVRSNKKALDKLAKIIESEIGQNDIAMRSGYIPHMREGRFMVKVTEKFVEDGVAKERTVHREQTDVQADQIKGKRDIEKGLHLPEGERAEFIRRVAAGELVVGEGTVAKGGDRFDQGSMLASMLDSIERNKDLTASEREAALKALAKDSLSKFVDELSEDHTIENNSRRLITGFSKDADVSTNKGIEAMASKAARIATRQKLTNFLIDTTRGEFKDNGKLREDARKLIEAFETPDKALVNNIKGVTYLAFLGGSPASAMLQHFQQYVLAAPVLGQYLAGGNYAKTQGAIMKASFDVFRGIDKLPEAERKMMERMIDASYIQHPELVNLAAQVSDSIGHSVKPLGFAGRLSGVMMSTVEFNNRAATALAAFRLYGDKIKPDGSFDLSLKAGDRYRGRFLKEGDPVIGEKPFGSFEDFASHVISEAHFDPNRYNKADIERGTIGALMMQFKMFPIHMLQTAMRLPARQRVEVVGTLLLLSGAGGLPFATNIQDLIDAGSEWLGVPIDSKRARTEAINAALGEDVGNIVNKGALSALGVDIGARIGSGDIVPFIAALRPSNEHKEADIAKGFGASFSYATSLVTALGDVGKGEYRQAALKAAPVAVGNIIKAAELASTGNQRNQAGDIIRTDVGKLEAVARALGLNSSKAAAVSEVKEFNRQEEEQHAMVSKKYAKAFARATFDADPSGIAEAETAIVEWNRKHFGTPLMIKPEAVRRAVKMYREKNSGELDELERKIKHSKGPERAWLIDQRNAIEGMGEN